MGLLTTSINASIRGYKPEGIPNQDVVKFYEDNSILINTISDGLGSSKYSLEGANTACNCVIMALRNFRTNADLSLLDYKIRTYWTKEIELKIDPISNYRTTNSFVAILKKEKKIVVGQLGDVLVSLRIDGLFRAIGSINKDFSNETSCLGIGREDPFRLTSYNFMHSFDFIIASDGVADELILDRIEDFHDYLKNKFQHIEMANRNHLLKQELSSFLTDKNNDDKSLLYTWTNSNLDECYRFKK